MRRGTFDAVGDGNPVPKRAGCPRPEGHAPGRVECPRQCRWQARKWWRGGDGLRDVAEGRRLFAREVTGLGGEVERARRPACGGEMTTLR